MKTSQKCGLYSEHIFIEIWHNGLDFGNTYPIFKLDQDIYINTLMEVHEVWHKTMASRVHTRFKRETLLVFDATWPLFELDQDINKQTLWKSFMQNVASRGHTRFWSSDLVFDPTWPIFKSDREIIKINILVKFHEDWSQVVTSRAHSSFWRNLTLLTSF